MRVLWVSLVEFPPLCKFLGRQIPPHCGWLYSSLKELLNNMPNIELGVIIFSYGNKLEEYHVDGIDYYLVPSKQMSKVDTFQVDCCKDILRRFVPDLIHIHGTEYSLAQAVCMSNDSKIKTLVNIQGLAGPYTRYADGGLSFKDKLSNITLLDFYRGTFLLKSKHSFKNRANCENYVLRHVTDVVGRTQWDHDHVLTVNPNIHYHFMNETLRDSFYDGNIWNIEKCQKYTIFVSNSGSALKGAHQVIKALPIILKHYPNTKVKFCGSSVMNNDFKTVIRFQGYHLYLRRLVKRLKLQNHVSFLGTLSEEEMKNEFLSAHVYVMPSSIENSPNSLCEAQILGVPVVASYCGGIKDLVKDGETGYIYRFEEIEMLAQCIIRLFGESDFSSLSNHAISAANKRHNRHQNSQRLVEIYKSILCIN